MLSRSFEDQSQGFLGTTERPNINAILAFADLLRFLFIAFQLCIFSESRNSYGLGCLFIANVSLFVQPFYFVFTKIMAVLVWIHLVYLIFRRLVDDLGLVYFQDVCQEIEYNYCIIVGCLICMVENIFVYVWNISRKLQAYGALSLGLTNEQKHTARCPLYFP
jgi:hypothetical protein